MIYGLYLSATGLVTNSYQQDVIANNLANVETTGFKKDLAMFMERRTARQERGLGPGDSNGLLERLGGGVFAAPTAIDTSQGELEPTGRNLDCAIEGRGFFTVSDNGHTRLTRSGHFIVNRNGHLSLANAQQQEVLDVHGAPIKLDSQQPIAIGRSGDISQGQTFVARIGVTEVADPSKLTKRGASMLDYADAGALTPARGTVHSGFLERGNVEPTTELSSLIETQRQLEANANMIRYQDQTLNRLVNDVGRIG